VECVNNKSKTADNKLPVSEEILISRHCQKWKTDLPQVFLSSHSYETSCKMKENILALCDREVKGNDC